MTGPPAPHPAPQPPPVRTATALAVITLLLVVGRALGLVARLVPWGELGLHGVLDPAPDLDSARLIVVVLALVVLVLVMAGLALGIASLVLSIIVVVRGRGLLRRGAVLLLIPVALGMMFSLDVSGDLDALPAWTGTLLHVLSLLGDLVVLGLTVTGLWFLVAGLRRLRRPPHDVTTTGTVR